MYYLIMIIHLLLYILYVSSQNSKLKVIIIIKYNKMPVKGVLLLLWIP